MPTPMINRLLWIGMLGVLLALAYTFDVSVYLGSGRLTVQTDPQDERTVILKWRGEIAPPMKAKIEEAFKEHRGRTERFVLSLSSPGGAVGHGGAVIRLLRDIRRTHKLETVLEGNNTCASMCVPIYLQGELRRATPRSRWMFHEVSLRDVVTDEKQDISPADRKRRTDKLFDDYFRPAGVSDKWITATRVLMQSGDVWRTGDQLMTQSTGIIHEPL
jgi:hypothetical protein